MERAAFAPYGERAKRTGGRHRNRVYPVLSPIKRERRRKLPPVSAGHERCVRSIDYASWLMARRRWLPCNPLDAFAMHAEDVRYDRAQVFSRPAAGRLYSPRDGSSGEFP